MTNSSDPIKASDSTEIISDEAIDLVLHLAKRILRKLPTELDRVEAIEIAQRMLMRTEVSYLASGAEAMSGRADMHLNNIEMNTRRQQ